MMRIGELAKVCATTVETVRFYEREGLLAAPVRSAGNYRLYSERAVDCIAFIRHCRALDMTLEEIRVLLRLRDSPDSSCAEVSAVLEEHIGHVSDRIVALRKLKHQLQDLHSQCRGDSQIAHCEIMSGLGERDERNTTAHHTSAHVPGTHHRPVVRKNSTRQNRLP